MQNIIEGREFLQFLYEDEEKSKSGTALAISGSKMDDHSSYRFHVRKYYWGLPEGRREYMWTPSPQGCAMSKRSFSEFMALLVPGMMGCLPSGTFSTYQKVFLGSRSKHVADGCVLMEHAEAATDSFYEEKEARRKELQEAAREENVRVPTHFEIDQFLKTSKSVFRDLVLGYLVEDLYADEIFSKTEREVRAADEVEEIDRERVRKNLPKTNGRKGLRKGKNAGGEDEDQEEEAGGGAEGGEPAKKTKKA